VPSGTRRLAQRQGGVLTYLHGDPLGSASLATNARGANITDSDTRYYPYGVTRPGLAGTGLPTDRRFTGQREETSLGFYDYGARPYDPALGRFLQADTLVPNPGNPQSLNRYAYVVNNPLRYTDPSGHWIETAWDIANIGWDIYEVQRDPGSAWNWAALVLDVGAAVLPVVPGGVGLVVRGGKALSHADEVVDAGRVLAEAASHADEAVDVARAANRLDDTMDALRGVENAAEIAGKSSRPPIVIGENMIDRVGKYAEQIRAQTINDFIPAECWSMEANEAWIKQMRAEGREIIDIGPDFERRAYRMREGIRPDAPAYNLERQALQGYERYHKVFQRSGKYWGSVPGLDWE